jgi:hypothetical protein
MEFGVPRRLGLPLLSSQLGQDTQHLRVKAGVIMELEVRTIAHLVFAQYYKETTGLLPLVAQGLWQVTGDLAHHGRRLQEWTVCAEKGTLHYSDEGPLHRLPDPLHCHEEHH